MIDTHRARIWQLAALVVPLCLAACANGNGAKKGPVERPPEATPDVVGEEPLPGVVRIAKVDRSQVDSAGIVRYYVDNVSGKLQEDLSWSVHFLYPPLEQGKNLTLPYSADPTVSKDLLLVATKRGHELVAQNPKFATRKAKGEAALATRLYVQQVELLPMVARDATTPEGTKVLNGKLECVGLSPADDRYKSPPSLWIELQNITNQPVGKLELKAVFMASDGVTRAGETSWTQISGVAPGAKQRATLDLSRIDRSVARSGSFVVKVRTVSDIF